MSDNYGYGYNLAKISAFVTPLSGVCRILGTEVNLVGMVEILIPSYLHLP